MFQVNNLTSEEYVEPKALLLSATYTTDSSLPPQHQHTLKKIKLCPHYGGEEEGHPQCPADRALEWLRSKGIQRGKPQDLFDKARCDKKIEIGLKIGRQQKTMIQMTSSLLNRRAKKSVV